MSRTKQEWELTSRMVAQLVAAGISYDDAWQLRRISMTLQRWFEGECGNSNDHRSWVIVRGYKNPDKTFEHDDEGDSYEERHFYRPSGPGSVSVSWTRIPDRERGARARLTKIMAKYPALQTFIQGDPRGTALYILRPGDVPEGCDVSSCYSRGIGVHQ